MKKYLAVLVIAASLSACASPKLETPEGTYRWQRGGISWQPGKWVLETPIGDQPAAAATINNQPSAINQP